MKVLVHVSSEFPVWIIPEAQVARLREAFPRVEFAQARTDEAALAEVRDADVVFAGEFRPPMLAAAERVRWIHSPAAGVGNMLYADMVRSPIVITNSRGIHARPIAEHVLGVTLALFRKLPLAARRQAAHAWAQDELWQAPPMRLLEGARMTVAGLGAIGSAIARLAAAVGVVVRGTRRTVETGGIEGVEAIYPPDRLPELLAWCDILVLAAPLTPATHGFIGSRELRMMRREAVLVNIGRGKLVREAELAKALRAGTIAGAALDVFEHEPLDPASPLWDLPQVLVTPHTAGARDDYWDCAVDLFAANLGRFVRGDRLVNVVDKSAGY